MVASDGAVPRFSDGRSSRFSVADYWSRDGAADAGGRELARFAPRIRGARVEVYKRIYDDDDDGGGGGGDGWTSRGRAKEGRRQRASQ